MPLINALFTAVGRVLVVSFVMVGVVIAYSLTRKGIEALGFGFWTACYVGFFVLASTGLTVASPSAGKKWEYLGLFAIPALLLLMFGFTESVDPYTAATGTSDVVRESMRNFAMVPVYLTMYGVPVGVFIYLLTVVLEESNQDGDDAASQPAAFPSNSDLVHGEGPGSSKTPT